MARIFGNSVPSSNLVMGFLSFILSDVSFPGLHFFLTSHPGVFIVKLS